jgi:hypothetical protein
LLNIEIGSSNAEPTETASENVQRHRLEQKIQTESLKTRLNDRIYIYRQFTVKSQEFFFWSFSHRMNGTETETTERRTIQ